MADIFVFGDSIGVGAWDEQGGWVDRVKQNLMQRKLGNPENSATELYNLSIDGDTSGDVSKRIYQELLSRRKPWSTNEDVVLVAIGTNDVYAVDTPDNFPYSPQDYVENLSTIFDSVNSLGLRIAFQSLDPVDEQRTMPCSWGPYYWSNERVRIFNNSLKDFCEKRDIPFNDMFEKMLALDDFPSYMFDGAHPNTRGHLYMYQEIMPFIDGLIAQ